ncbi:MAG: hypothetical protein VW405_05505 [Rhodospirillaceae bacterium]
MHAVAALAPLILAATLLAAGPVQAKKVWRPEAIFTAEPCSDEMNGAEKALAEKLKTAGLQAPSADSRDAALNGRYAEFLTQVDRAVRERARTQADAAGKWRGRTLYKELKFKGRKHLITSCQLAKERIPLNTALRVVTRVAEASATEKIIAAQIAEYVKIKNARRACRAIRPFAKARHCLAQYPEDWLDRYLI